MRAAEQDSFRHTVQFELALGGVPLADAGTAATQWLEALLMHLPQCERFELSLPFAASAKSSARIEVEELNRDRLLIRADHLSRELAQPSRLVCQVSAPGQFNRQKVACPSRRGAMKSSRRGRRSMRVRCASRDFGRFLPPQAPILARTNLLPPAFMSRRTSPAGQILLHSHA